MWAIGSNPGVALLGVAALLVAFGAWFIRSCGGADSLIGFGAASILVGVGLWFLGEWVDSLVHVLLPAVVIGVILLSAGWYLLGAAGCAFP